MCCTSFRHFLTLFSGPICKFCRRYLTLCFAQAVFGSKIKIKSEEITILIHHAFPSLNSKKFTESSLVIPNNKPSTYPSLSSCIIRIVCLIHILFLPIPNPNQFLVATTKPTKKRTKTRQAKDIRLGNALQYIFIPNARKPTSSKIKKSTHITAVIQYLNPHRIQDRSQSSSLTRSQ